MKVSSLLHQELLIQYLTVFVISVQQIGYQGVALANIIQRLIRKHVSHRTTVLFLSERKISVA